MLFCFVLCCQAVSPSKLSQFGSKNKNQMRTRREGRRERERERERERVVEKQLSLERAFEVMTLVTTHYLYIRLSEDLCINKIKGNSYALNI